MKISFHWLRVLTAWSYERSFYTNNHFLFEKLVKMRSCSIQDFNMLSLMRTRPLFQTNFSLAFCWNHKKATATRVGGAPLWTSWTWFIPSSFLHGNSTRFCVASEGKVNSVQPVWSGPGRIFLVDMQRKLWKTASSDSRKDILASFSLRVGNTIQKRPSLPFPTLSLTLHLFF